MCVLSGSSPASRRPFWVLRHSRTSGGESSPQVVKADMFFGPHPFQQLLVYPNNAIWTVYPACHILPSLVRENQYDILKSKLDCIIPRTVRLKPSPRISGQAFILSISPPLPKWRKIKLFRLPVLVLRTNIPPS